MQSFTGTKCVSTKWLDPSDLHCRNCQLNQNVTPKRWSVWMRQRIAAGELVALLPKIVQHCTFTNALCTTLNSHSRCSPNSTCAEIIYGGKMHTAQCRMQKLEYSYTDIIISCLSNCFPRDGGWLYPNYRKLIYEKFIYFYNNLSVSHTQLFGNFYSSHKSTL